MSRKWLVSLVFSIIGVLYSCERILFEYQYRYKE